MPMTDRFYHIGFGREDLGAAPPDIALLSGDPERARMIAQARLRDARALVLTLALLAAGCTAGPPWYLGAPLSGRPAIPEQSRALTVAEHRRAVEQAHQAKQQVIELAELEALEARGGE